MRNNLKCPGCGKREFKEEYAAFSEQLLTFVACAGCGTVIGVYPKENADTLREINDKLDNVLDLLAEKFP